MYKEDLKSYLDDLASRKPAPGGGSASALAAATGVALLSMVANFTVGKEIYRQFEQEIKEVLSTSEDLRQKLMDLVDEDVTAYKKLASAYKLAQDNVEDRRRRAEAIQQGLKQALSVPLEICKASHRASKLCPILAEKGNVNLISDVGVAIVLLESAFAAALLNVEINLKGLKDREYILEIREIIEPLEKELIAIKDGVWHLVKEKMSYGKS